jgi:predicted MFS family arabinose efflux permease
MVKRQSRWNEWRQLDQRIWRMAFARTVNTMGLSLVMSFLGVYVVSERGYPAWLYGAIALGANLGQSLVNAWAGALSDRIGRRPLISTALLVRSLVIAILGTQVLLHAPLWSLAITMVISSALRGCFEPVAYALVSDVAAPDERIAAFALQRVGTNLGWAIGPALGGVLTLVVPYGAVFYFASVGLVVAGLVTRRVDDAAPASGHERAEPVWRGVVQASRDPVLAPLLLGTFLAALAHTQMFSTFAIFMSDRVGLSKAEVGMLYTVNGVAVVILQLPAVLLIHRLGSTALLSSSSLLHGAGLALVGLASNFLGGAAAIFVITCAEVLHDPSHQAAVASVADPRRRGRMFGLAGLAQLLGVAVAPLLGGILLDSASSHVVIWSVIGAIGILQAWAFSRFRRRLTPQLTAG